MAQYYGGPQGGNPAYGASAQNLQFYPSTYSPGVPGQASSQQGAYGYGAPGGSAPAYGGFGGSGAPGGGAGVSGRMGEQGGLRTGWLAAFSTEGYDGEPPLLEELGVNFSHIRAKTLAVLNPFQRIDQHLMDDSDLAGPIISFLLFGTFLLFSGKVHFGYIYGLALLGSTSLHIILSLMSPDGHVGPAAAAYGVPPATPSTPAYPDTGGTGSGGRIGNSTGVSGNIGSGSGGRGGNNNGGSGGNGGVGKHGRSASLSHLSSTLTFPRSASVLGYCLLPLVATSLVGIVMPMDTPLGIVMTTAAICWCTYSASSMFCAVGRMRGMRGLVAYPLALFYVGFGIMGVFSSRGSGSMAKVIGGRVGGA
ncbi:golgi membrane protein [Grosmannia clavigera kw1407]|uniref:Golgi membrane protein n=1 Tax=Grosmannia clavigera (strain kw1407 / UAMH 11150) TaxID=655863 RepID=F0XQG3_GROCL|nr:golgi membrane protein [Grosmannia clavigera kw1407]EFX00681.1 golgi membrane protein [Grosmannia clavigera kw1407]